MATRACAGSPAAPLTERRAPHVGRAPGGQGLHDPGPASVSTASFTRRVSDARPRSHQ